MSSQTTERREKPNAPAGSAAGVLEAAGTKERPAHQESAIQKEDRGTLIKLFHQMVLIRRFEEKCAAPYSLGKIRGLRYPDIGPQAGGVRSLSASCGNGSKPSKRPGPL